MSSGSLQAQLAKAEETIRQMQEELAETNRGMVALSLELEKRVEEREAANKNLREEIIKRTEGEIEIERLNRLYATLSQVNQTVIRVRSPEELAREACRVAVEIGGFKLAWIGCHDLETRKIKPLGWAGEPQDFVCNDCHMSDESRRHHCFCGVVMRKGLPIILNDLRSVPEMQDWQSALERGGLRASATFPIRFQGAVWGVFGVYAGERYFFQRKEIALLEESADDISFALEHLAQEERRKQVEELAWKNEQRFQTVASVSHDTIWDWDLVTNTVWWSDGMQRVFGYRIEEVDPAINWWSDHIHPEDRDRVLACIHAVINAGKHEWMDEYRFQKANGAYACIFDRAHVMHDENGKPTRMIGGMMDITARKQAEEEIRRLNADLERRVIERTAQLEAANKELRESEERFRVLTQNLESAVSLINERGELCIVNKSFRRLFELGEDADLLNINSRDWSQWQVFDEAGRLLDVDEHPVRKAVRTRTAVREVLVAMQCPGRSDRKWLLISAEPILDAQGNLHRLICSFHDITERKRAEEETRRLVTRLAEANKELESFSYSVSHDLRAPLRGINGFANILAEDYGKLLDDQGRRVLATICSETNRMGKLIDDLLAFSRLGRQAMHMGEVDMGALAQSAYDACAAQAAGREIRFTLCPLPPAQGDAALLAQVWANLISNAVKYTRAKPMAEIEVAAEARDGELVYRVWDNGAGFDMEYVHKLFGVFQRLHGEEEFEGTGIGLALAQRIVRRHGGRAWAEGKVGEGATFFFALPAAPAAVS